MAKKRVINKSMSVLVASAIATVANASSDYDRINFTQEGLDKQIYNDAVDTALDPQVNEILTDAISALNGKVAKDGKPVNLDDLIASVHDSTTAAGGYGCYGNCYSNCHGSRNIR